MNRVLLASLTLLLLAASASAQRFVQETQRLVSPLSPIANFGQEVAIDGDTAVVGAPQGSAAVVYERTNGVWAEVLTLLPTQAGSFIGRAVDVSADTIAIGSESTESVDLYVRSMGSWAFDVRIDAPSPGRFGFSVALEGDTLLVGAPETPNGPEMMAGAGHVYRRSGGVWSLEQTLVPATAVENSLVAWTVALSGDTLLLGAAEFGFAGGDNGSAYVYDRSGTTWTAGPRLRASDGQIFAGFGDDIALDADTAAVLDFSGAAYVFERAAGLWSETAKLFPADLQPGNVPRDLDLFGGTLAVGYAEDDSLGLLKGGAYLFAKEAGAWEQVAKVVPEADVSSFQNFGEGVALTVDTLLSSASFGFNVPNQFDSAFFHDYRIEEYPTTCYGDGASQFPGCASCPCGNDAPTGTRGGCLNSRDRFARLGAAGVASVSNDSLQFDLIGASADTFALLFSGSDLLPQSGPCPPGSGILSAPVIDGLRCTGGSSVVRLGVRATTLGGQTVAPWGGGVPAAGLIAFGGFAAGETRHFQCFYREFAASGCGSGQNSTNAVTVTLMP